VTDTGGTTSHPAVLAREFGIPAVIGTSVATQRIVTGDRLKIDGTTGRVEIIRAESVRSADRPVTAVGS
jgi:pyruvate,water dikinase